MLLLTAAVLPFGKAQQNKPSIILKIDSSKSISGTMGDYATVKGVIQNTGTETIKGINTYISIVDVVNKVPIDLEDWSAQKSIYLDILKPSESIPLDWRVHFITPGKYSLSIIAITPDTDQAFTSPITHFDIQPKVVLNPNNSLFVAIGMPLAILILLLSIRYLHNSRRKR